MCYTLSAEKILLNYFAAGPKKTKISFEEIAILSCLIVKRCDNSIITRISVDDIRSAVYKRESMFQLESSSVILKNKNSNLFDKIGIYNQAMPEYVKDKCVNACHEYISTKRRKDL